MTDKNSLHHLARIDQAFSISAVNSLLNQGWIYLGMYAERKLRNQGDADPYVEEEPVFVLGLPRAND